MREYVACEGVKPSRRPLHPPDDCDLADAYDALVQHARPGVWVSQKRAKSDLSGGNISKEDAVYLIVQLEDRDTFGNLGLEQTVHGISGLFSH